MGKEYRAYLWLIRLVSRVDMRAAKYLQMEAPKLLDFSYNGDLVCCFTWSDTPQGHVFWNNIYKSIQ